MKSICLCLMIIFMSVGRDLSCHQGTYTESGMSMRLLAIFMLLCMMLSTTTMPY